MRQRLLQWGAALAVLVGGSFNVGCGLVRPVLEEARDFVVEEGERVLQAAKAQGMEVLAKAEKAATDIAEKKIAELREKSLAVLDAALLKLGTVDDATGATIARTWRDFDLDKDGDLAPGEIVKLQGYVAAETAKRVMAGTMSPGDALALNGETAKGAGGVGAAWLLAEVIRRRRRAVDEKKPPPAPAAPPPPPEPASAPATAPAS